MTSDVVIAAQDLHKRYSLSFRDSVRYAVRDVLSELNWRNDGRRAPILRSGEFWALQAVSLELRRGEALGVVGGNGSGKSTLLRTLGAILRPDGGRVRLSGSSVFLDQLSTGMDPSLTGIENVYLNATLMGMTRARIDTTLSGIVQFAGIEPSFMNAPMQTWSSGMRVRLGYAVAAHLEPDVLLLDETLAVGDADFQHKCLEHMRRYLERGGSVVLVSHNPLHVHALCTNVLWIEKGRTRFAGPVDIGIAAYLQAQQERGLLEARARLDPAGPGRPNGLRIERVTIEPLEGEELEPTGGARVTAFLHAASPSEQVRVGFRVMTSDSQIGIAGAVCPEIFPVPEGGGRMTWTIATMPLTRGVFSLHVYLLDPNTWVPLCMPNIDYPPLAFSVSGRPGIEDTGRFMGNVFVPLDVSWKPPGKA